MFKLSVLHQHENFLIINKPSGLVVNRSKTSPENTLQDLLEASEFFSPQSSGDFVVAGHDFISRTGIVHRLDKDTSGLLFIALNEETFVSMQQKFKSREVNKEYIAVVLGVPPGPSVEVDAPIARDKNNRVKFAVSKSGKHAFTKVTLLNTIRIEDTHLSAVQCLPTTGRTHQLRVHLSALRNPIVGDRIYTGRKQLKWAEDVAQINRLMLHASRLEFNLDDQEFTFYSDTPTDFDRFMPTA